ncbi:MAG: sodium-dependent bicarbonate transport family permease [Sphingobacteriales bacterium]|nr:MAG: sodium-dependent bicarbonate transport family permease [Sphingobacteriales bacterium]
MQFDLLISNITSPTLLFFLLGIIASLVKSDLEIPPSTSKFISLYLLFSIGFKGGQELSHSVMSTEIALTLVLAVTFAVVVPIYTFFFLKRKFSIENAGAIAAAYGSVSAVTFVTAISFLDNMGIPYGGHMVAAMALMEAPAIVVGVMLMRRFSKDMDQRHSVRSLLRESLTNGSVLMILGSLVIGLVADVKQAEGIKPFTTDIFKGFLAIFLLEMGMVAARRFQSFRANGVYAAVFALVFPPANGLLALAVTHDMDMAPGNKLLFTILASSASYIAVPAAMRQIAPKADPGLYIPMALAITFPLNITLGLPIYWLLLAV